MNTNKLKIFAREARRKLLQQVGAKLEYVLATDSAELREKVREINKLKEELHRIGKEQLIEKVSYTWFNRLMALRFMDANDYQPSGIRIISPKDGYTVPQILDEAKQGGLVAGGWKGVIGKVNELLDGKIPSRNPQNEAFRYLLIAACNALHKQFTFLFEKINDYTELLLPDDLTSEFSIVHDIVAGMSMEDCQQVEIIGWLYQFYISEKKDGVFAKKGKVKKEDIPAATQLFTPRWIVEYMVQNTLGKLWLQNNPKSELRDHMPYFIESPSLQSDNYLIVDSIEEIKLLDQASGSGHILVYAFELYTKIYEEEGYSQSDIPQLIIEKNLYGFEIDERAAQLAEFSLLMKARGYYRRLFRKNLKPNILCFKDTKFEENELEHYLEQMELDIFNQNLQDDIKLFEQATNYGSLIKPKTKELPIVKRSLPPSDIFLAKTHQKVGMVLHQISLLNQKYHCVVDNPPYMGGGNMNKQLSDFVKANYPDSKSDLMAAFMECGLNALIPKGYLGMINQHSWMFLSSYEKLRKKLIGGVFFDTLLHLGPRTFPEIGGEVVQNSSFTFWNTIIEEKGAYIRLVDEGSSELKRIKALEAIQNPDCSWFYTAKQKDFEKIPGSPIGYWLKRRFIKSFNGKCIKDSYYPKSGLSTTDNQQFLRYCHEIEIRKVGIDFKSADEAKCTFYKWFPYNKGGPFRRWYGNLMHFVNWKNDGEDIRKCIASDPKKQVGGRIVSHEFYFKESVNWSALSSGQFSCRYSPNGYLFDSKGPAIFFTNENDNSYLTAFLNSKVAQKYLDILSPTLDYNQGPVGKIPLLRSNYNIDLIAIECINLSKEEWNVRETSWGFTQNELIHLKGQDLEEVNDLYQQYWKNKFYQLHYNEEELNRQFIKIYGLQEELTPDVPLKDITILKDELDQKRLKEMSEQYSSGWLLVDGEWSLMSRDQSLSTKHQKPDLPFNAKEIFSQFVSYSVGCMMGRYSLDKEGLILANQGETVSAFVRKVSSVWWMVDGEGNWKIDNNKYVYEHYKELQRTKNLGAESKIGEGSIFSDEENAKGRIIQSDQPPITFWPDEDAIIPVLDDEWFEDDIVGRFFEFLKVTFGKKEFQKNLSFLEEQLGKDIRKYFVKDFYKDHIKRYKKRPIYWLFSSPKGHFSVLIYLHRYTPDTLSNILNNYLREFVEKLKAQKQHFTQIKISGSTAEQTKATKRMDQLDKMILDCEEYERDILYPLATERIEIDLDDGVLVNYNKFGKAVKEVQGLNDKKAKEKVRGFDWIDRSGIRD